MSLALKTGAAAGAVRNLISDLAASAFLMALDMHAMGVAELFELASRPDRYPTGAAARDNLKVGELELERDGTAANAGALAVAPHLVDDLLKRVPRGFVREENMNPLPLQGSKLATQRAAQYTR